MGPAQSRTYGGLIRDRKEPVGLTAATNRQVAVSFVDLSLKIRLRAATVALRGADNWPTFTNIEAGETFVKTSVEFIVNSPDHE